VEHPFHNLDEPMPTRTGTQSIDRASQLLVLVVEEEDAPTVGELAQLAGLPKSTTSRLVGALERQGLVQRLGDRGRLTAGPVLLRYANRDVSSTLVELAAPSLRRLADASGETINLAVPGVDGVEHLAQEDTAHFVGVTDWVGRKVPFEPAANGKVFLAFSTGSPQFAQIRARGYATSIDELEIGLTAMAAPVLGAAGDAIAALSISGPTARLTSERIVQLAPLLIDEATQLARRLGHRDHARGAA
jgi:IclR family acetate operon transcriptional repressor